MGATRTPEDLDQSVEKMTNAAKRGRIAKLVGCKTSWDSPLDKRTLNSVYAYLTGEFFCPRAALHKPDDPRFESKTEIQVAICVEADIGEPDRWIANGPRPTPQGFRSAELAALIETLTERGDQRSWTDSGG